MRHLAAPMCHRRTQHPLQHPLPQLQPSRTATQSGLHICSSRGQEAKITHSSTALSLRLCRASSFPAAAASREARHALPAALWDGLFKSSPHKRWCNAPRPQLNQHIVEERGEMYTLDDVVAAERYNSSRRIRCLWSLSWCKVPVHGQ
jgi:hypothetical protein